MSTGDDERLIGRLFGPPHKVWKEQALGRLMGIEGLLGLFERQSKDENRDALAQAVRDHLEVAREVSPPTVTLYAWGKY